MKRRLTSLYRDCGEGAFVHGGTVPATFSEGSALQLGELSGVSGLLR